MTLYQLQSPPRPNFNEWAEMRIWMDYWPRVEGRPGEYMRDGDFLLLVKTETDWSLLWSLRLRRTILLSRTSLMGLDKVA